MYKLVVGSCKHGKSALTVVKSLNIGQTSYCVKRFSKKRFAPSYISEDKEQQHGKEYGARTNERRHEREYGARTNERRHEREYGAKTNERRHEQQFGARLSEHQYKHEQGSQTRHKSAFKIPLIQKNEYKTSGYEKHAKQLDAYDDDWNDERKQNPDTFGGGVGKFQEISDKHPGKLVRKSRKKDNLPNNWANEFGTMGTDEGEQSFDKDEEPEDLIDDPKVEKIYGHVRLARYQRRHIPNWYARKIQKFGKEGEVRKAIEVFDEWMLKRDRVKPTTFEYTVLMKLLADVGYTEKAFMLYRDMLPRLGFVNDHIYTCLFNACANSPWPEYGLEHARRLRHTMLYKDIKPNYITYLSMIKAFGYCGDISTAFLIADEAAQLNVTEDLLANMLCACISDKEAGFRHAIVVWRKFRALGLEPSLTSYKLLLHCVAECGIGDPNLVRRLFNQPIGITEKKTNVGNKGNYIEGLEHAEVNQDAKHYDETENKFSANNYPEKAKRNLQNKKKIRSIRKSFSDLDELMERHSFNDNDMMNVELTLEDKSDMESSGDTVIAESNSEIVTAKSNDESHAVMDKKEWWEQDIFENSLSVLPVQEMETTWNAISNNEFPDILDPNEDFRYLVNIKALKGKHERLDLFGGMEGVLQTLEARNIKPDKSTFILLARSIREDTVDLLLSRMWAMGIKPDIEVYNQCIWETVTYSHSTAWALFKRLKTEELVPDVKTYTALAVTCRRRGQGLSLIDDMLWDDIMPNAYTICALLRAPYFNFDCKIDILEKMTELGIKCNSHVVKYVERDVQRARMKILEKEREGGDRRTEHLKKQLSKFLRFYNIWLKEQELDVEAHPWQTFKPQEDVTSN